MTVDTTTALGAQADWLWIVDQWRRLSNRLVPGGGNALNGMPRGGGAGAPIDVYVSDLMREIEDRARFYGQILMDETDWQPKTSTMPELLAGVVERYGHFTADDDRMALDFCDDASTYRERVRTTLERPAAPRYVGVCRSEGCDGDLYLRDARDSGICPSCGAEFTRTEMAVWTKAQLEDRLMTVREIVVALHIVVGHPVPESTVRSWVRRKRLVAVDDEVGLYRMRDALELAPKIEEDVA